MIKKVVIDDCAHFDWLTFKFFVMITFDLSVVIREIQSISEGGPSSPLCKKIKEIQHIFIVLSCGTPTWSTPSRMIINDILVDMV